MKLLTNIYYRHSYLMNNSLVTNYPLCIGSRKIQNQFWYQDNPITIMLETRESIKDSIDDSIDEVIVTEKEKRNE